jgi:hypothetical protein
LKLLRSLFLMLFVTALVWAAVVWRWQHTARAVEPRDVLVYLVALPLAVIVGFVALRWAWRRAERAQSSAAAPGTSAGVAAIAAPPAPSEQERVLALRILGLSVALPGAEDASAALELAAEPPTIKLDAQLLDRDGLGVFTRRCAALEPPELPDEHAALQGSVVARALALGERCVDAVLQAWPLPEDDARANTSARAARAAAELPLHMLWAIDEHASTQERAAIEAFVNARLPAWSAQTRGLAWQLELAPVRNGEALLLQAERRLVMAHRAGREELVLVVAAQSLLDERVADRLDAEGRLFTAQRGQGVMLGEGGAALLLAPPPLKIETAPSAARPAMLSGPTLPELRAQLHRLSAQRREKSADEAGRVTGDTLAETMRQALAVVPQLKPEALPLAIADTDAQRSRVNELLQALQVALPGLQMAEQCRRIGLVAGCTGVASAPMALALAAAHAHAKREPALMLTQADPHDRLAAVITPPPSPEECAALSPSMA